MILKKKILFSVLVLFSFFFMCESGLRFTNLLYQSNLLRNPFTLRKDIMSHYVPTSINPNYFCDMIHLNNSGQIKMAECLQSFLTQNNIISPSFNKIVFIGGSTSEGSDCLPKSKWPDLLSKSFKSTHQNLSVGGENSSKQNIRLFEYLKQTQNKVDLVVDGNWFNEILMSKSRGSQSQLNLLKLHATLVKYLYLYRFANNFAEQFFPQKLPIRSLLMQHHAPADVIAGEINDSHKFQSTDELVAASIENFNLSAHNLDKLSKEFKFKVVMLGFPYLPHFYKNFHSELDIFLNETWIPRIKAEQVKMAKKYNFAYFDSYSCFSK